MNIFKKLFCWVWGHEWNPHAYGFGELYCHRCRFHKEYDFSDKEYSFCLKGKLVFLYFELKYKYKNFKKWLQCPECKRKFGRHKNSDCGIPF